MAFADGAAHGHLACLVGRSGRTRQPIRPLPFGPRSPIDGRARRGVPDACQFIEPSRHEVSPVCKPCGVRVCSHSLPRLDTGSSRNVPADADLRPGERFAPLVPSRNAGSRAAIAAQTSRATKRGAMAARRGADRKAPRNVHDSYFRALLEEPERAADFLRCHLPADIVCLLADEPPELQDGTFVDDDLRNRQSDRLFRVKLQSGDYIFVIVEHASSVDPDMVYRLQRYRQRIWDRERAEPDAKPGRLTPILALVVYHGKARWTAPLSPADVITADPVLRVLMCGLGYRLLDLGRMPEDRLARNPDLKGGLLALAHAYRGPVGSRVLHRIRELVSEGTGFERQTFRYILDAFDGDVDTLFATVETKGSGNRGKSRRSPDQQGPYRG